MMLSSVDIVLIIHLVSVVFWIGGVGFVTMVIFPTIRTFDDSLEKVRLFLGVERRFSRLARVYIVVVGLSGLILFLKRGAVEWLSVSPINQAMLIFKLIVWHLFLFILFGAERWLMNRLFSTQTETIRAFKRFETFHYFLLCLTVIAIAFGVML